jgi:hypothetical protein
MVSPFKSGDSLGKGMLSSTAERLQGSAADRSTEEFQKAALAFAAPLSD